MAATEPGASWPPVKRVLAGVLIASVPSTFIGLALAALFRHAPTSPLELANLYSMAE